MGILLKVLCDSGLIHAAQIILIHTSDLPSLSQSVPSVLVFSLNLVQQDGESETCNEGTQVDSEFLCFC